MNKVAGGFSGCGDEPLRRRHVIWRTEHSVLAIPIYYAVQQFAERGGGRVEARRADLRPNQRALCVLLQRVFL